MTNCLWIFLPSCQVPLLHFYSWSPYKIEDARLHIKRYILRTFKLKSDFGTRFSKTFKNYSVTKLTTASLTPLNCTNTANRPWRKRQRHNENVIPTVSTDGLAFVKRETNLHSQMWQIHSDRAIDKIDAVGWRLRIVCLFSKAAYETGTSCQELNWRYVCELSRILRTIEFQLRVSTDA